MSRPQEPLDEDPWKRPLTPPTAPSTAPPTDAATVAGDDDADDEWEYEYVDDDEYDEYDEYDEDDDDWGDDERQIPSLKRALTAAGTGVALAALVIISIVFALVMFIRLLD